MVKNPLANTGDPGKAGSIPRLGRCPGEGNGNPFQCSFLGNPMDRGAWRTTTMGSQGDGLNLVIKQQQQLYLGRNPVVFFSMQLIHIPDEDY